MGNPYASVSITGYNANPPPDDGTETAANEIEWAKHKNKLADPLKDAIESINSNTDSAFDAILFSAINTQTGNYTVQSSDRGKLISVTGTTTITLIAAGTATSGFSLGVRNDGSGTVTVDGNSSETINGSATITLEAGASIILVCDGSNWEGHIGSDNIAGLTASASELNKLDGLTATTAELNKLDGLTATTVELNKLDGLTATTAELNKLDGLTATTAELNNADQSATSGGGFMKGPTSSSDESALGFNTWRTPNNNRPTLVIVNAKADRESTGNADVILSISVDESGGTSSDYGAVVVLTDKDLGSAVTNRGSATVLVPAGGSYELNASGTSDITVFSHIEYTL